MHATAVLVPVGEEGVPCRVSHRARVGREAEPTSEGRGDTAAVGHDSSLTGTTNKGMKNTNDDTERGEKTE